MINRGLFALLRDGATSVHTFLDVTTTEVLHRIAAVAADERARHAAGLPFAHPVPRHDVHRTA